MTTLAELRQANLKEQKKNGAAEAKPDDLAAHLNITPVEPSPGPVEPDIEEEQSAAFLQRVREAMSSRTMHPVGSKVTTDMSPKLFMRAKQYCVDHGNITLRQVFLDLLINFLEEEGY
jgi:hypothetical protein